jgi:hypothetical protein
MAGTICDTILTEDSRLAELCFGAGAPLTS